MKISLNDTSPLFQWDTNRTVVVTDAQGVDKIGFALVGGNREYVPETTQTDSSWSAPIPNILLQTGSWIRVYVRYGGNTIGTKVLPVVPRVRPADYIYTETEILTWESVEANAKDAKEQADLASAYAEASAKSAEDASNVLAGAVRWNETQSLTDAQKLVALGNIGAVGSIAQSLTDAQKTQTLQNIAGLGKIAQTLTADELAQVLTNLKLDDGTQNLNLAGLTLGSSSLQNEGYTQLANGLYIKWGSFTSTESSPTVEINTNDVTPSFTNLFAFLYSYNPSAVVSSWIDQREITDTTITIQFSETLSEKHIYWLAIGM